MIDSSVFQGKRAAYFTLGCKLNFSETSTFGKMLQELGVQTVEQGERADICLINTCSVTEVADHKCRQAIHRMVRQHPGAFVVVTGCYAQLEPERISRIEGVDLVLGSNEKASLVQFLSDSFVQRGADAAYRTVKTKDIKSFAPSCSRGNRTRYFLRVRLLLHLLYDTLCPRLQPQPHYFLAGGASRGGGPRRGQGDCADGRQHWRLRKDDG